MKKEEEAIIRADIRILKGFVYTIADILKDKCEPNSNAQRELIKIVGHLNKEFSKV